MIVAALPPTGELVRELVDLAQASWHPPELLRYLATRARAVEVEPVNENWLAFLFPACAEFRLYSGVSLHNVDGDDVAAELTSTLPEWGMWVPFGVLDDEAGGLGEGFVEDLGWVEVPGGLAGYDALWDGACATVAATLGPPHVTTTDTPSSHAAAWQVGSTALLVAQTNDFYMSYHLQLCVIRLYPLEPGTGLPDPETLQGWCYSR